MRLRDWGMLLAGLALGLQSVRVIRRLAALDILPKAMAAPWTSQEDCDP